MGEGFFRRARQIFAGILGVFQKNLEAVPIAEVRRLASKFFVCRRQKSAGILDVFQDFLAKAGEKFAVKMRAAAIGTAS